MTGDEYQAAFHKIVNKVDQLVTNNPAVRAVFTGHIDQLCKLAEDYGQSQQPYSKKLEDARNRIEQSKNPKRFVGKFLTDICPPPKGYVKMNSWDNCCINVPRDTIYRPAEPANPLLWFGIFGDTSIQRKPTEDEKLMCDYVRMAVIHDYELRSPTDNYIFSADYKGKWFEWDSFREAAWGYYHPCPNQGITYRLATAQEKVSQLNRALDHVEKDLAKKSTETEQDATPDKRQGIIVWIKRHPHSYGLTGSFILLISAVVVGWFNEQWRPWCWGTASLAFLVLILSLLGGRSR